MVNKRDALAAYRDERVTISGMFEKFNLQVTATRQWRVALLQDVYAEIEGKQIDLGHIWIQYAEPLRALDLHWGDRIRCNCRVTTYNKRLPVPNGKGQMQVDCFSLSFPTESEVICRGAAKERADKNLHNNHSEFEKGGTKSPVKLIFDVKELAVKAGGWKALRQLVDVLGD